METRLYKTFIPILHHTTMLQPSAAAQSSPFWDGRVRAGAVRLLKSAKPVATLRTHFCAQSGAIEAVAATTGRGVTDLVYLPMKGRKSFSTVFLDPATAQVLAFMPLDSF